MKNITMADYRRAIELYDKIKKIEDTGLPHSRKNVIKYLAAQFREYDLCGFNNGLKVSVVIVENGNKK